MVAVPKPWPKSASADAIALAIVAAARVFGDDPLVALGVRSGLQRRCLGPAVRALSAVTGAPKERLARKLGMPHRPDAIYKPKSRQAEDAEGAAVGALRAHVAVHAPFARPAPPARPAEAIVPAPPTSRAASSGFGQLDRMARFVEPSSDKVRATVSADDRALIEAAIAAGKVTVLPKGQAAGLTMLEGALWAAPPPRPEGGGWGGKASSARGGASGGAAKQAAMRALP